MIEEGVQELQEFRSADGECEDLRRSVTPWASLFQGRCRMGVSLLEEYPYRNLHMNDMAKY